MLVNRERVDHQAHVRQGEQPGTHLGRPGCVTCAQGESNTERGVGEDPEPVRPTE